MLILHYCQLYYQMYRLKKKPTVALLWSVCTRSQWMTLIDKLFSSWGWIFQYFVLISQICSPAFVQETSLRALFSVSIEGPNPLGSLDEKLSIVYKANTAIILRALKADVLSAADVSVLRILSFSPIHLEKTVQIPLSSFWDNRSTVSLTVEFS